MWHFPADRIARLDAYENWRLPTIVEFEAILGREDWDKYWGMWESINTSLHRCQEVAEILRKRVSDRLRIDEVPDADASNPDNAPCLP